MNIIDSSGWLEYFTEGQNFDFFAKVITNKSEKIIVPTIVIYEVFKKILTEKDENTALQVTAQFQKYQIEPFDDLLALSAAKISHKNKIPMADSIIYAIAKKYNAIIWTQDEHFRNLPNVKYIKKL